MREITAGRHTIVPADVDCHCRLDVGSFCSIASGLAIVSGQHPGVENPACISNFAFYENGWAREYPPCEMEGRVDIGSDVWVGQGVTIMEGVVVGHGAVLAAGSVVVKDVPPYGVVAGNPAEVKKRRFTFSQIERLCEIEWWEWPDEKIERWLKEMTDVGLFIRDVAVPPGR